MYLGNIGENKIDVAAPPPYLHGVLNKKAVKIEQNQEIYKEITDDGAPNQFEKAKLMAASYQASIDKAQYADQSWWRFAARSRCFQST